MTVGLIENESLLALGTCVIAVDEVGTIKWLSPQLERFLGVGAIGQDLAKFEREIDSSMIGLALDCANVPVYPLRGAWLRRSDGERVFVGSPGPDSKSKMVSLGLSSSDFLSGDPWTRFLILTDEAVSSQAEAKKRVDELKSHRGEFESARDEMRDARRAALNMLQNVEVERKRADRALRDLETAQSDLIRASRNAGMAEVVTGVLHNVGNILNSVNVSVTVVADKLRRSKATRLVQVADLFAENAGDLATFMTEDEKGRLIPSYLARLARILCEEKESVLDELSGLISNVDHIKQIVSMQQSYTGLSGVKERAVLCELVEDAIKINTTGFGRQGVEIVRDFADLPPILIDRHKLLQILVNLLSNAKAAVSQNKIGEKTIRVQIGRDDSGTAFIGVLDNGIGIPQEDLTRIFAHGFTTREEGHGFGLHSSALAAKEFGGKLTASSEGSGLGSTFTLLVPLNLEDPA